MFQKILLTLSLLCLIVSPVSAWEIVKNEAKIQLYKSYIENRAGNILKTKNSSEKMDLMLKVQTLLWAYEKRENLEGKENFINFLYAFEEVLEMTILNSLGEDNEKIIITIIDDVRCKDCMTESMLSQLESLAFLSDAQYIYQDFSDTGVSEYLRENNIQHLPAIIFNTNNLDDGWQISPYLMNLPDGNYTLSLWANFDPFETRSQRGYLILAGDTLDEIKQEAYILWNENAEITWIEYSDIECPFCARLHNDGTIQQVRETFWDDINIVFQHFPLEFHTNARQAAEALECIGSQYGVDTFYNMVNASYEKMYSNNFSFSTFYEIAEEKYIDTKAIMSCVDDNTFSSKVDIQIDRGMNIFDISGTPGSILINTITWEYTKISGAYPYESFKQAIEDLLR